MSLLDELKRCKVFRVGATCVLVAWLAIQSVSIGFPAFDVPPWVLRVFILVALLGFPLSVAMAWVARKGLARGLSGAGRHGFRVRPGRCGGALS